MLNADRLRYLFSENRVQYLSELGIPEPTYYRILKQKSCSLPHLVKIAAYFNEPIANLIIIPEEFLK